MENISRGPIFGDFVTIRTERSMPDITVTRLQSTRVLTATLLVMVNVVKGGGRAPPTLTSQANFTLMMECTPESGRCHSVYSVDSHLLPR